MTRSPSILARLMRRVAPPRETGSPAAPAGEGQRAFWESRWSRPDFMAPWLGRSVSSEVVDAVEQGWFRPGAAALDIGCGEGDIVAWLAARGFPSLGVDIAPSAVERARSRFGHAPGAPEFIAADVCRDQLPPRGFAVLIDRGCFHQIPVDQIPAYVDNIAAVAAVDARMLLFVRAFRDHGVSSHEQEREQLTDHVRQALSPAFTIVRSEPTWLDRFGGAHPDQALGGLCFWLERQPA